MELQRVVVIAVGDKPYQLTESETRDVLRWLREPKIGIPEADPAAVAAAVFLERLLDEPELVSNPPLTDSEAGSILVALGRMGVNEGLTDRQRALHDALLAHFGDR